MRFYKKEGKVDQDTIVQLHRKARGTVHYLQVVGKGAGSLDHQWTDRFALASFMSRERAMQIFDHYQHLIQHDPTNPGLVRAFGATRLYPDVDGVVEVVSFTPVLHRQSQGTASHHRFTERELPNVAAPKKRKRVSKVKSVLPSAPEPERTRAKGVPLRRSLLTLSRVA